jgi:hypothetical protein
MKRDVLGLVKREVVRQFPEMAGAEPKLKPQGDNFLLTFKGTACLPGGRTLPRVVNVVVDESGRILRMSTSK